MNESWKKDYPFREDLSEESLEDNHSLKKMFKLIGLNQRVIDFGCATGYFAQLLTKKGCKVTGVEINSDAAKVAEQYCEQVIVADLDLVSPTEILPCQAFDVAVFGDVLEHLREPWKVLQATKQLLKPDGYVVASIPNIAHGAIRLALLQGRFEYTELGILDNTHLRFFTRKTVEELFENSGYFIDIIDRTTLPVFAQSALVPSINKNEFNSEIIRKIEQEEEADTVQFILRAFPCLETDKYAALRERYCKILAQLERSQSLMQQLQSEMEQARSQMQETQAEKEQLQAHLQNKQLEIEQAQVQAQQLQTQLEHAQSQIQDTQAEMERSQSQAQHFKTEFERSQSQVEHIKAEIERSQSQVQHFKTELERSQFHLQQTQADFKRSQAQLKHTQAKLERLRANINGIKSSNFWKLRQAWFRVKQATGLANTQTPNLLDGISIPGIKDIREIKFIKNNSSSGVFDGINGSKTATIKVRKTNSITASGWAVLANESRAADKVLITYGKNHTIVAVAPVNLDRPDVAQALNNSKYSNSGWSVTLDPASLPTAKITLQAWAYNSVTKEAFQLNYSRNNLSYKNLAHRLKYTYAILKVKGMRYALAKLAKKVSDKLNNSPLASELLPTVFHNQDPYYRWMSKHFPREADLQKMAETIDLLRYKPFISVIVPVYNPPEKFLREAIDSVINQVYPYWELCIADDASTQPHVRQVLEEYSAKDSRIKVVFREKNGHISRASNSAIEVATGEFVALLDHDDLLTPEALYEVAFLLNKHPDADMIYSDEDKVNEHNQFRDPYFKPDWCPDSFLSRMYTCHLGTYRKSIVDEIGGFRVGYEGSQDYDFVLRFTEKTDKIFHIPKILYHWRIHPQSAASGSEAKPYAYIAAEKALSDALSRRGEQGKVSGVPGYLGHYRVQYEIKEHKLVSIIIPTKNLGESLNNCLHSIFSKSTYPNYEVVVIDNGSTEAYTAKIINTWETKEPARFKCYKLDIPFNFSQINNFAVSKAKGDYLLFLNNDTEVISPDWIDSMVEQVQRSSIGAVGALLLYPDQLIQHAGIVLGIGGIGSHSHKSFPSSSPGYFGQTISISNYSAVTAACLMCRREVFEEIGGFDEKLAVAYNDVDFCLKMVEKGYRNLYLPHVVLYHHESKSRGSEDTPAKLMRLNQEAEYLRSKWQTLIDNDPCYSPHLTRDRDDYSINI